MSVGKYSPTVSRWYAKDQNWWNKNGGDSIIVADDGSVIGYNQFDKDGYDSYGYHKDTEQDRAGNTEYDYLGCGEWIDLGESEEYAYPLYENVSSEWWGGDRICPTDDSLIEIVVDGKVTARHTTKDYNV